MDFLTMKSIQEKEGRKKRGPGESDLIKFKSLYNIVFSTNVGLGKLQEQKKGLQNKVFTLQEL